MEVKLISSLLISINYTLDKPAMAWRCLKLVGDTYQQVKKKADRGSRWIKFMLGNRRALVGHKMSWSRKIAAGSMTSGSSSSWFFELPWTMLGHGSHLSKTDLVQVWTSRTQWHVWCTRVVVLTPGSNASQVLRFRLGILGPHSKCLNLPAIPTDPVFDCRHGVDWKVANHPRKTILA